MSKSPEKELQDFLATLPAFRRKEFELGICSFTNAEMDEWRRHERENPNVHAAQRREYERFLQRIPSKLREYRKRLRKEYGPFATLFTPTIPKGRPRLDAVVGRVEQLRKEEGLSLTKSVMRVNQERASLGLPPITTEQIRGLLKYRKRKSRNRASPPEKS